MYSLALSPKQIDEAMAKAIIDEYQSPSSIMDPAIIDRIIDLVSNDINRLRIIQDIVSNTILHCNIILLPDDKNPFSPAEREIAGKVIDRQREILEKLRKLL